MMSLVKQRWRDFITLPEPLRTAQLSYWAIGAAGVCYRWAQHGSPREAHLVIAGAYFVAFVAYFASVFQCYPQLTPRQRRQPLFAYLLFLVFLYSYGGLFWRAIHNV